MCEIRQLCINLSNIIGGSWLDDLQGQNIGGLKDIGSNKAGTYGFNLTAKSHWMHSMPLSVKTERLTVSLTNEMALKNTTRIRIGLPELLTNI